MQEILDQMVHGWILPYFNEGLGAWEVRAGGSQTEGQVGYTAKAWLTNKETSNAWREEEENGERQS